MKKPLLLFCYCLREENAANVIHVHQDTLQV